MRFKFLIAGFSGPLVRVLSLEPESCFNSVSTQALQGNPTAVGILEINDQLYLHIGIENKGVGTLVRTIVDSVTGGLSDSRSQFLGHEKITLSKITLQGKNSILALSSKSFLCYSHMNQYTMTPLSYTSLEHASRFSSTQCSEGIIGVRGTELRIIQIERPGDIFTQRIMPTKYTPTKM